MANLTWKKLLNDKRRKDKWRESQRGKKKITEKKEPSNSREVRTEIERDFDRILFSTPVRRLADKTQVFPLERNDSVRTRLTHSHEVSNLARSIGVALAYNKSFKMKLVKDGISEERITRDLSALLATIGLAHDLGNPPFGHQGENAIQSWFEDKKTILSCAGMNEARKNDFLRFEGNAQTLRLLTKLQLINDNFGLNLSYASLAAIMKYPVPSDKVKAKRTVSYKKHGFFQSEKEIVTDVWLEAGLSEGVRHPLTYIMEACDDIAYNVLDAEDAVKKNLVSFSDLIDYLSFHGRGDKAVDNVCRKAKEDHAEYRNKDISPAELNDISMLKFRVHAIAEMVQDISEAFVKNYDLIMAGKFTKDIIEASDSSKLCDVLGRFDKLHAYTHRSVLEVELQGYNTIRGLMDFLWEAISNRKDIKDLASRRKTPFASYAYNRISENYRRIFEDTGNDMPARYKELQLLTDMMSGMTDSFAISLYEDLKKYHVA